MESKMKTFKQFMEDKYPNQDPPETRPEIRSVEDDIAYGAKGYDLKIKKKKQ